MIAFPNLPLPKQGIKPLNTRRLLILYPSYTQKKNFRCIGAVFCTWTDLLEATFLSTYPDPLH